MNALFVVTCRRSASVRAGVLQLGALLAVACLQIAAAVTPTIEFMTSDGWETRTAFDVFLTNQWYAANRRLTLNTRVANTVGGPLAEVDDLVLSCAIPSALMVPPEAEIDGTPCYAQWNGAATTLVLRAMTAMTNEQFWWCSINYTATNVLLRPLVQVQRQADATRIGAGETATQTLVVTVSTSTNALDGFSLLSVMIASWDYDESGVTITLITNGWSSAAFHSDPWNTLPVYTCDEPWTLDGIYVFTNVLQLTNSNDYALDFMPGVQCAYYADETPWTDGSLRTDVQQTYDNGLAISAAADDAAIWRDTMTQGTHVWDLQPKWSRPDEDSPGFTDIRLFRAREVGVDGRPRHGMIIGGDGSNIVAATLTTPDGTIFNMGTDRGEQADLDMFAQTTNDLAKFTNGTYVFSLYDFSNTLRKTYAAALGGNAVTQTPQVLSPAALCITNTRPTFTWAPMADANANGGVFLLQNTLLDNEEFFVWQDTETTNHTVSSAFLGAGQYRVMFANQNMTDTDGASVWSGHLSARWGLVNVLSNSTSLAFARATTPVRRAFRDDEIRMSVLQYGFLPGTSCTSSIRFGDGMSTGTWSALHAYDTAGAYTVDVVVADDTGVAVTGSVVITIHDLPLVTRLWSSNSASVALSFPTIAGGLYRVACADALKGADWSGVLAEMAGDGATNTVTDPAAGGGRQKAYRLACDLNPAQPLPSTAFATPYVNEADMQGINEAYSATTNCPWGFEHQGIDFFPTGDGKQFRAVCDGVVSRVELVSSEGSGNWEVQVELQCDFDSRCGIDYAFEPMSPLEGDGTTQLAHIAVTEGEHVTQGTVLGTLLDVDSEDGAHVHYGVLVNWNPVSPEPYFSATARESVLRLIRMVWGAEAHMTYY